MSDLSRKERLIGKARRLLDVAIAKKDVRFGVEVLKTIAVLEGWVKPQNASKKSHHKQIPDESAPIGADWGSVLEDQDK